LIFAGSLFFFVFSNGSQPLRCVSEPLPCEFEPSLEGKIKKYKMKRFMSFRAALVLPGWFFPRYWACGRSFWLSGRFAVVLNIGGALSITAVGYGYDLFQSYFVVLCAGAVLAVTALILLMLVSKIRKKK